LGGGLGDGSSLFKKQVVGTRGGPEGQRPFFKFFRLDLIIWGIPKLQKALFPTRGSFVTPLSSFPTRFRVFQRPPVKVSSLEDPAESSPRWSPPFLDPFVRFRGRPDRPQGMKGVCVFFVCFVY